MNRPTKLSCALALALSGAATFAAPPQDSAGAKRPTMDLGAFSSSLAVEDLAASKAFYEKLGFVVTGGDEAQNWLVLRNGTTTIGLFQGMFEKNIMTFNPGWNSSAEPLEEFTDVRELQRRVKAAGIVPVTEADEATTGPASFVLLDPDGNMILFDQHVE